MIIQSKPRLDIADSGVPPPVDIVVPDRRKPVLYLPNGNVLVRVIGF